MKKILKYIAITAASITIGAIVAEMCLTQDNLSKYNLGKSNLPKTSAIYKLATENIDQYIISQKIAVFKKADQLQREFCEHTLYLIIGMLFICDYAHKKILAISEKNVTVLKSGIGAFKKDEINMGCIFFILYLSIKAIFSSKNANFTVSFNHFVILFLFYYFILPFLILVCLFTLKKFGSVVIIAIYITYIIHLSVNVLKTTEVDLDKMEKVSIDKFSPSLQKLLLEYKLEDKVYIEKIPRKNMNAALIGYNENTRIEIYGDFDIFEKSRIYGAFIHEIGHAKDLSMFKKVAAYLSVIIMEGIVVLLLFQVSSIFANNKISSQIAFLCLFMIYKMWIRQWAFVLYKVISQNSELKSDIFAKQSGYPNGLARVLYEICIESNDQMVTTRLYNLLTSGHPPIDYRIEQLATK